MSCTHPAQDAHPSDLCTSAGAPYREAWRARALTRPLAAHGVHLSLHGFSLTDDGEPDSDPFSAVLREGRNITRGDGGPHGRSLRDSRTHPAPPASVCSGVDARLSAHGRREGGGLIDTNWCHALFRIAGPRTHPAREVNRAEEGESHTDANKVRSVEGVEIEGQPLRSATSAGIR